MQGSGAGRSLPSLRLRGEGSHAIRRLVRAPCLCRRDDPGRAEPLHPQVKAVELLAGLAVLLGFRLPLMLLAVLPVSFTVWYWDTELQGWWTGSAVYGWSVLGCNLFLCLAYWERYRAMFVRDAVPRLPLRGQPVSAGQAVEARS